MQTTQAKPYKLTKSLYLAGLQCTKKLWKLRNQAEENKIMSSLSTLQRFETGRRVGAYAREKLKGGVFVNFVEAGEAAMYTNILIKRKTRIIFEAAFLFDGIFVKTDILRYEGMGKWSITEVKSSTKVKSEHIEDVAIQYYCATGAGLNVTSVRVQFINPDCVYPDLDQLFTVEDVTNQVLAYQNRIPARIKKFKKIIDSDQPEVAIGEHCEKPYECTFKEVCWLNVPEQSIFTIPRLSWDKRHELIAQNILDANDIPNKTSLSNLQKSYVQNLKKNQSIMNRHSILNKLENLSYPIHFVDFETDFQAIPKYEGSNPYNQIPFQFSCHILDVSENLEHIEYLHTDTTDPREAVAERLIECLGTKGSIVAYNAAFEMRVIKMLAVQLPRLTVRLLSLIPRIWDLMEIFTKDYFDPRFNGSNSLKSILPVLAPNLSYENLTEVHDGTEAGIVWNTAINESNKRKRERSFANLRAYCERDTEGLVEIYNHLKREVTSASDTSLHPGTNPLPIIYTAQHAML